MLILLVYGLFIEIIPFTSQISMFCQNYWGRQSNFCSLKSNIEGATAPPCSPSCAALGVRSDPPPHGMRCGSQKIGDGGTQIFFENLEYVKQLFRRSQKISIKSNNFRCTLWVLKNKNFLKKGGHAGGVRSEPPIKVQDYNQKQSKN